jgi:hypothetical protein
MPRDRPRLRMSLPELIKIAAWSIVLWIVIGLAVWWLL